VTVAAERTFTGAINDEFWLDLTGDFRLTASLRTRTDTFAGISLVSTPGESTAEPWRGRPRLYIALQQGQLVVAGSDGSPSPPSVTATFPLPARGGGPAVLGFEKRGAELVFSAQGNELGRMADPNLFPWTRLFFGAIVAPGNMLTVDALSIAPLGGSIVTFVHGATRPVQPSTGPTLRSLATPQGVSIGASVAARPLRLDDSYRSLVANQFNMLAPGQALLFETVHPSADRYDFCDGDDIVSFAEANGMRVRGTPTVWHRQLPRWLIDGRFNREQILDIMRDHITTVVGRYRGRIAVWDVVNEAVEDDGRLRNSFWLRAIGPEYIRLAFQWAHEADPDALLFLNEYGAEGSSIKSDAVYRLVEELVAEGVPIHGVGMQAHFRAEPTPTADDIARNMARLAALGLQVQITEMDVRLLVPASAADLQQQATVYERVFTACRRQPSCTAFVGWNVHDGDSWIPQEFPGYGSAHLFDETFRPKPAHSSLMRALSAR
jgi:endo-1,4-beta-xylanase